jgi:predicted transposase/invertase (TIGR01784 family)
MDMSKIQLAPDEDILNFCSDPIFKAVFTKNTKPSRGGLMALISAYTGHLVEDVVIKENEPAISDVGNRLIRFDLSVKFDNGKLANVEMNMNAQEVDLIRGEYYLDRLHASQNIKGEDKDYQDLEETYQISFFNNRTFFDDKAVVHNFEFYDKVNKVSLGGKTKMITVELDKTGDLEKKNNLTEAEEWAYVLKNCTEKGKRGIINRILANEEGISMAVESLLTISKDENEAARLLTIEKNLVDWQSGIVHAERRGIKIGEERSAKELAKKDAEIVTLRQKLKAAGVK